VAVAIAGVGCTDNPVAPSAIGARVELDAGALQYDPERNLVEGMVTVTVENTGSYPIRWSAFSPTWEILEDGGWVVAHVPTVNSSYPHTVIEPGDRGVHEFHVNFDPPRIPGQYRIHILASAVLSDDDWRQIDGNSESIAINGT
jgi:hypothetical protein